MRFLHNATPKIIHRDFKSPNVLMSLTKEITCKVSDFGASRAVAKCFGRSDLGNPCMSQHDKLLHELSLIVLQHG